MIKCVCTHEEEATIHKNTLKRNCCIYGVRGRILDSIHGFGCVRITPTPPTGTDYTVFRSGRQIFITAKVQGSVPLCFGFVQWNIVAVSIYTEMFIGIFWASLFSLLKAKA